MGIHHELLSTENEAKWRSLLPINRSVFGSVEFASIKELHSGHVARLFVFDANGNPTVYPFFLRPLSELPFVRSLDGANWDSTTPEFSGPFCSSETKPASFSEAVHHLFCDLGVVSEFMHLNPWSDAGQMLTGGELCFNREIVWVNTMLSEDELWRNHFSHACRKNLKRAASEKVRVFEAKGLADIQEFHRIYLGTMDRNQASKSYYFPTEYFVAIFEHMSNNARFVMAEHNNQIVAAILYLHDDINVYSYLGGADYDHQQVRPTNAIVHDTIGWARRNQKERLVLGGGYQPDDGIFRFKASLSSLRAAFYTFQRVHLRGYYESLQTEWSKYYGTEMEKRKYFPSYRFSPQGKVCSVGPNE